MSLFLGACCRGDREGEETLDHWFAGGCSLAAYRMNGTIMSSHCELLKVLLEEYIP